MEIPAAPLASAPQAPKEPPPPVAAPRPAVNPSPFELPAAPLAPLAPKKSKPTPKASEVFSKIDEEGFSESYKIRVLFHAYLYVGIYLELTEGNPKKSLPYLRKAASNAYGRSTGTYMWQVARIHYELSKEELAREAKTDKPVSPKN